MKKSKLLQRKASGSASNIKQTQIKISTFFTKISKPDVVSVANGSKIISDVEPLSETLNDNIDKKRKASSDTFDCEVHENVTKKSNAGTYTNTLKEATECSTDNIESCKESVTLSTTKDLEDLEDICSESKENKIICDTVVFQKIDKKEMATILTMKTEQNRNPVKTTYADVLEINNDDVLKESQDLNTIASKSSTLLTNTHDHNKIFTKVCNSKNVESFENSSLLDGNEFDDLFDQEWNTNTQINFAILQRCKVIDMKQEQNVTILTVQQMESKSVDTVACSGFWKDVQVKNDDIVTIKAKKESQQWIIDNNNGFLIIQPDTLISATTIMSGLFCNRRAILSEKFRKIESLPNLDADYSTMTLGSLVHQWLQKALQRNVYALSDIIKLLDSILQSKDTIDYLYASEMSLMDCRKQMMEYAPRIFEFIQHYIKGNKQKNINDLKGNFQGRVCKIQDIEESLWIPQLGMKGRIDVTAQVNINSRRKLMPLEVKTGRPSYSFEHKGQVILYLMMMALRDQDIDIGLLLYLKDNSMQEIKSTNHEKRDLILLRNTLAYYFSQKPENLWNMTLGFKDNSDLKIMELPEPINHHSACIKCPYQTLCCAYLTRDSNINLSPSHPLTPLVKELLCNFDSSHLDYVIKWVTLLQLEESYENNNSNLNSIWTMSPEKREAQGSCICNLKVIGKMIERDDRYQYTFARVNIKAQTTENSAFGNVFTVNDYIIVSTDVQINVATGYIIHVSEDAIIILLNRDIMLYDEYLVFHIDKYPSTGLSTFNYANIGGLLSNDETSVRLRRIIIDRKPATFAEKLSRSIISSSTAIISDLNENQQRAVLKAIAANEYILIKGMPGTGKTQTLVALIELLQKMGSTVLITAYTHSAVDNVLLKLLDKNIDFLRLGSTKQIHSLLSCKTEEYVTRNCDSPESLEALYNSKTIIATTCYGAYHALLRRRVFDVCVVDESAQILQPAILRPLYSARKFILVGDPDQLPPIVKSKTAANSGADESLFVRLDSDNNTINLVKQYRMNRTVMKLANDTAYHGKLIPGNKQVENAILTGSNIEILSSCEKWIRSTLSKNLDDSVVVLNTGSTHNLSLESSYENAMSDQIYSNIWEVAIISRLVQVLLKAGVNIRNIGIIAPYNAQITLLKQYIDKEVEVNTVDQYQGRDKDIILYSCTKSVECGKKKEFEILDDQRRLTVAITRAKHKLIIIVDKATLMRYTPFKNLFNVIDEKNVINLHDGEEEFSWKNIVQSMH